VLQGISQLGLSHIWLGSGKIISNTGIIGLVAAVLSGTFLIQNTKPGEPGIFHLWV